MVEIHRVQGIMNQKGVIAVFYIRPSHVASSLLVQISSCRLMVLSYAEVIW